MRVLAPAFLLCTLALQGQTQPTFYAAFEDGMDALQQKEWAAAAAAFRRALVLRPQPAARLFTYGNNLLKDYYPSTRLAQCELELGNWDGASRALRQAEARGEPAALRDPLEKRLARALEPRVAAAPAPSLPPSHEASAPAPKQPPLPADLPAREGHAAPLLPEPLPAPSPAEGEPPLPGGEPEAIPGKGDPVPLSEAAPASRIPQPSPERAAGPLPLRAIHGVGAGLLALSILAFGWRLRRPRPYPRSGAPVPTPMPPESGFIGPYEVIRMLGQGGFATTYLARHRESGLEVALKVPHPHRLNAPDFVQSFAREARLCARMDHPNLVRLLDPGPPEGAAWIALEFVPGPTLAERLREAGAMELREALTTALCLARAVACAHAHGVIHRDLKPANIILGPQGPKVMDLGIARDLDVQTLTTTGTFFGTPLYAAPEVHLGTGAGPAADRYSLGVILFEMLTGTPPFQGSTLFAILDLHRSAPVPALPGGLGAPPALDRLLARLLDKDPERRPEDGELVAKLEALCREFVPEGPRDLPA